MLGSAQTKHIILSIMLIIASVNITKTVYDILQSSKRLGVIENEVIALEETKGSLEKTIDYKKSDEFVAEKARNDLNLVLPGEKVYVIVGNVANSLQDNVLGGSDERNAFKDTNLYHWYRLFF